PPAPEGAQYMVTALDHGIDGTDRRVVVNGNTIEKAYIIVPRDQAESWPALRDGGRIANFREGLTAHLTRPSAAGLDRDKVAVRVSIPAGAAVVPNLTANIDDPTALGPLDPREPGTHVPLRPTA